MAASKSLAELTAEGRYLVQITRQAAGFPQEDDSAKSLGELYAAVLDVGRRQDEWYAYEAWRRRHRLVWRWWRYTGVLPELPAPYFMEGLAAGVAAARARGVR